VSLPSGAGVVLNADDFALTDGVSTAIEELALQGRLSATSALVNMPGWPGQAQRLAKLRTDIAIGLHFNLTLGHPCGPLPTLAPSGQLPPVGALIKAAVLGRISAGEIEAELTRQIERFTDSVGHAPDFIDGHQHVHALPGVRSAVIRALQAAFPDSGRRPLVRDPFDHPMRILERKSGAAKHMALATLAMGFGLSLRAAGFMCNDSFAGVSAFDRAVPYERELDSFFLARGSCHIVMCHPGHPSPELAALDPVVERREDEFRCLTSVGDLPAAIWHPNRSSGAPNWPAMTKAVA
jgi:predicted glycoside hydrolase/deacetylase ChbG (UPF0249 family)